MKFFVSSVLFLVFPFCVLAQTLDLEESPDQDLGQTDRTAEELSFKDIKVVTFSESTGKPVLDGVLDEAFWEQAQPLEITRELFPERFGKAIVKTDILAVLTDTHLYIGITAHDSEPENLRSYRRIRDGVKDDDYVSIVIDATGNLRRKFEFRVNPHGALTDVLQDQVSNRYIYDWDTRWDATAKITSTGYVVEMEIPLDSIKQPAIKSGETPTWLVLFKRTYPRAVDRTFGAVYLFQKETPLEKVSKKRQLDIMPYFIFHPDEERNKGEPFDQVKDHDNYDAGMDLKLAIDSATFVAATINPNYTEVEADIARNSINNPFTPFQPEKREFFQNGRELYTTYMPVVYTRNILKPKYGLGISHTGQKLSTGGFFVDDRATVLIMPDNLGSEEVEVVLLSNSTALRYITGKKGTAVGLLATARTATDYKNYVGGVDGLVNFGLDDKLRYQLMYSTTEYPEEFAEDLCDGDDCLNSPPPEPCLIGECEVNPYVLRANPTTTLKGHGIRVGYKHDSPKSIYWVNYLDYDPDFRADLGFEKRIDIRQFNVAYGRNWYAQPFLRDKGKSRIRAYLVGNHIESSAGEAIEDGADLWGEFRGSFQTVLRAGYRAKRRAVNRIEQDNLALGDNAPRFDESYLQWYYEIAPDNRFIFNLDGRYGDIADPDNIVLGRMKECKPRIRVLTDQLKFELAHVYRDYDMDDSTLYTENFFTLQLAYHPKKNHTFRVLFLNDKTTRDAERFLGNDPPLETEKTVELTYLYRTRPGLSILAGGKLKTESEGNSEGEITDEFTSGRQVYIKFLYDYAKIL